MRHNLVLSCMLILSLAGAAEVIADTGAAAPVGVAGLADLLKSKGLLTADEYKKFQDQTAVDKSQQSNIKLLVDLLRSKGSLSNDEAAAFLEKLNLNQQEDVATQEKAAKAAAVALKARLAKEAEEAEKAKWPFLSDEELKTSLLILREQGVLGNDEAAQIGQRIGKKWNPSDEDELVAGHDLEIEYNKTTLPKEGLLDKLNPLQRRDIITKEESERIKARFLNKLALERVTNDIGLDLRREVNTQVAEKVISVPEWVRRIKLSGDMRLRYEGDFFDEGNAAFGKPDKTTEVLNSTNDRHRLRIRARLAATAKVNNELEVGIGLATGNTTDPVSTNATLGDSLNKKSFTMDQAYLKWTPTPSVTLWGGRFANPWFSTDLVWDQDVNFDGVAVSYKPQLTSKTSLFMTAGAFPIQEVEMSSHDKWLFGGQLGVKYQQEEKLTARLAVGYYHFENTVGVANDTSGTGSNDWTAPLFQQKGNSLMDIDPSASVIKTAYASEFRELNLTGSLDLGYWHPVRVILAADYVNNIGFRKADVEARRGASVLKETEGYQFGVTVGHPQTTESGQWKGLLYYKHLESDAVMDAFTDSDFHLGGTNAKGWIMGGDLGINKNFWLSTRWFTANEISGPPLRIDVFHFNINARF